MLELFRAHLQVSPSGSEKKSQHEKLNERLTHLNAKAKACMILAETNMVVSMKAEMGFNFGVNDRN